METTKFNHPNSVPVNIRSNDDLEKLGLEMRREAAFIPIEKKPVYDDLDTLGKVEASFKNNYNEYMRTTRYIIINSHLCSLAMTMDKYEGKAIYHLSMVEHVRKGDQMAHAKIPDAFAQIIADTLLGGLCHEVPHEGKVYIDVRDFVMEAE